MAVLLTRGLHVVETLRINQHIMSVGESCDVRRLSPDRETFIYRLSDAIDGMSMF